MLTHKQMVKTMLEDLAVKEQYDAQAADYALLDELLSTRQRAGLTQAEVAQRNGCEDTSRGSPGIRRWQ